mgnify:FL=1
MELSKHLHGACAKLRQHNLKCSSIGVMLKTKDFITYYDKKILIKPTDFELTLQKSVNEILPKIYRENILYRSTGIILEHLSFANNEQLSLFDEGKQKEEKLSKCIDNIEKRFGKNSIRTGF